MLIGQITDAIDQATGTLRNLGITPARPDFTPITRSWKKSPISIAIVLR
jgi:hypothetical protein